MEFLIQTWSWISPLLIQRRRAWVAGCKEGAGQGDRAVVGQVKELVDGVKSSDGSLLRLSVGPVGASRGGGGERSASVYLPPLLFTPWTERREVEGNTGKQSGKRDRGKVTEREEMRRRIRKKTSSTS